MRLYNNYLFKPSALFMTLWFTLLTWSCASPTRTEPALQGATATIQLPLNKTIYLENIQACYAENKNPGAELWKQYFYQNGAGELWEIIKNNEPEVQLHFEGLVLPAEDELEDYDGNEVTYGDTIAEDIAFYLCMENPTIKTLAIIGDYVKHKQITQIPKSLYKLGHLKALYLREHRFLHQLSLAISKLQQLEILNLNGSDIYMLPSSMKDLHQLETLSLEQSYFYELPECIAYLSNLKQLNLKDNKLEAFPTGLSKLTSLRELDLELSVDLDKIDCPNENDIIGNLVNLKRLYLRGGKNIKVLSKGLSKLSNLEDLFIENQYGQEADAIQPSIDQCQSLKKLTLNSNPFTQASLDAITRLGKLETVNLSGSKIGQLPVGINAWTNLRELNLSGSGLANFPLAITNLVSLESLDVSHNLLCEFPLELGQLANLKSLDLSSNQLTNLPPTIGNLFKLVELNLSGNAITSIPPTIRGLEELVDLDLHVNHLKELPWELLLLTKLQKLNLAKNHFTTIPSVINKLAALNDLDFSNNQISYLPADFSNKAACNNYLDGIIKNKAYWCKLNKSATNTMISRSDLLTLARQSLPRSLYALCGQVILNGMEQSTRAHRNVIYESINQSNYDFIQPTAIAKTIEKTTALIADKRLVYPVRFTHIDGNIVNGLSHWDKPLYTSADINNMLNQLPNLNQFLLVDVWD